MDNRRAIHFGSYWMGSNDIVNLMQRCMARVPGIEAVAFDVGLYGTEPSAFVTQDGGVHWINDDVVSRVVSDHRPDFVVCNAGGLSFTPEMHGRLAEQGILRVGIALSDPDDFPKRSQHFARYFDRFYTNAVESTARYADIGVKASVLPFAADASFHRPLRISKRHDVVVVGAARPERVRQVAALRKAGLAVRCFGTAWTDHAETAPSRPPLRGLPKVLRSLASRFPFRHLRPRSLPPQVHGEDHVRALNTGTVYLSFAQTVAGFTNVKVGVFEAAACGACVLVQDFDELHNYFVPGKEIITYGSEADAVTRARELCANPERARQIGRAARSRVLAEHTWEARWRRVLHDLYG